MINHVTVYFVRIH